MSRGKWATALECKPGSLPRPFVVRSGRRTFLSSELSRRELFLSYSRSLLPGIKVLSDRSPSPVRPGVLPLNPSRETPIRDAGHPQASHPPYPLLLHLLECRLGRCPLVQSAPLLLLVLFARSHRFQEFRLVFVFLFLLPRR